MSKTIFFTLLSLAAVASCSGGQEGTHTTCFRQAYDLPSKSSSRINFSFKYNHCTAKEVTFLNNHAQDIIKSDMHKLNPKAFEGKTYKEILPTVNKNNCFVSVSHGKTFRIAFLKMDGSESFIPITFKPAKGASEFSVDYTTTAAATKQGIFYVFQTELGPVKYNSNTDEVIEDKYCTIRNVEIDESTEADDSMEQSGSVVPTDFEEPKPTPTPEPNHVEPTHVEPTHAKTLAELNAELMAQESAALKKRLAEEEEAVRVAELEKAKADKVAAEAAAIAAEAAAEVARLAAEKERIMNEEDDEIFKRTMEQIADADLYNNRVTTQNGQNILRRIRDENHQRAVSKQLLEREAQLKHAEEKERSKQLKIDAVKNQREHHQKVMEEIRNKRANTLAKNYYEGKIDQVIGKIDKAESKAIDEYLNREDFIDKHNTNVLKKIINESVQDEVNAANAEEKRDRNNRSRNQKQRRNQINSFKAASARLGHAMKMAEIRGKKNAEFRKAQNERFDNSMENPRKNAANLNKLRAAMAAGRKSMQNGARNNFVDINYVIPPADRKPAPVDTNYGAAMDNEFDEESNEYYNFEDGEAPANGMMGGWSNWHTCTNEEKDIVRNYFAMMFSQLRIHNIAVYAQNMLQCKQQVVAGKNYEVKLGFNELECNVKFHFDLQGIIHDISGNVSQGAKSCVALYAYPFNAEAIA